MAQVSMNLLGYAQGNAQMTAEVWNPATNLKIAEAPALADGTVLLSNIPAGAYQVKIRHANLLADVVTQTIYVQPASNTLVSVYVDPSKFKSMSIVDQPEANLAPLATMAESVELAAGALTNKMPGEILTAAWANGIALAISNLAHVVTALSRSVTPVGHNHLEYENKINEISTNFQTLVQTIAESTVRIQRDIEIGEMRSSIEDVFDVATVDPAKRAAVLAVLTAMRANINESPQLYSQRMRTAAGTIKTTLAPTIAAIATTFPQIVAAYNAVMAIWTTRSVRDFLGELSQPRFDLTNQIAQRVDTTIIEGISFA